MRSFDLIETVFKVMQFYIPFLFALCFHEYAHGWVARLKGDRTAELMGRLTLNPVAHADIIGTVILPIAAFLTSLPLFGWANPVPVDPRNLKNPKKDMFWIALAGPMSNFLLAILGAIGASLFISLNYESLLSRDMAAHKGLNVFQTFISVNVFLAIFNLLPLHPLDGGKVLARFLPDRINYKLEEAQHITSWILLALFISGGMVLISYPATIIIEFLLTLAERFAR